MKGSVARLTHSVLTWTFSRPREPPPGSQHARLHPSPHPWLETPALCACVCVHVCVCLPASHHVLRTPKALPGTPGARPLDVPTVCFAMETPVRASRKVWRWDHIGAARPSPQCVTADPSKHSCWMAGSFLWQKFIECTDWPERKQG